MTEDGRPADLPRAAAPGQLAVLHCAEPFTLTAGHRLRAARCLVCREVIGGQAVTVIGVAALTEDPCSCGAVTSDTFLVHAGHLPLLPGQLATALHRGLNCPVDHTEH